jgi:LacI family transcriptional regulator, repressor for deo operon, udp, cdd, tsx, nupC, and nupG
VPADGDLSGNRRGIDSAVRSVASTSHDVARLAGVSQPTVSLVLGGRGDEMRLSSATQQRVLAAAERLGFVPNHAARNLRRRSTRVVTVISPSLENPFFAEVIGAVQDAANLRGYATNVVLARDAAEEARAISHVLGGTADALVVASHYAENNKALGTLSRRGTPCVVLQQRDDDLQVPSITVDLEAGGYLATRHLIALGHRRIAHVTDEHARDLRRAGFLRALQEADIAPDPGLIIEAENSLAGGSRAAGRLLAMAGGPPSAVFAYNDQLALGLLHGTRRAGVRVPDDLAVVGFDNTVFAAFASPELTTVAHERNSLTAQMLFAMLDETTLPARKETVPIWLVVRESCGASRT